MDRDERLQFLNSPPYVLPGHKKITCPAMVYISGIKSISENFSWSNVRTGKFD